MIRYWIPIERAVDFALQALSMMESGDLFVPKMDEIKLIDFMRQAYPEAAFEIIGRRRGEKLREELMCEDDAACAVEKDGLWVIRS
jgi:FlaA1/EpsC-like NDP-sugar epimerase